MTDIVFVARLHKLDKDRLGFYVPSNVSDYYEQLTDGIFKVAIEWRTNAKIRDARIKFYRYNGRLRGVIPRVGNFQILEAGSLIQVRLEVDKE